MGTITSMALKKMFIKAFFQHQKELVDNYGVQYVTFLLNYVNNLT